MLELLRLTLPSITVIIGWFIVSRLQRAFSAEQETRKDRRTGINRLDEDLRNLRDKCIEYYTDPSKGANLAIQIKVITEDVRRQTTILGNHLSIPTDRDQIEDCLLEIIVAATGGKFETKDRIALEPSDLQLISLFNYSAKLLMMFEDAFVKVYPRRS